VAELDKAGGRVVWSTCGGRLDEAVYDGLYRTVGRRHMSQYIEDLFRSTPHAPACNPHSRRPWSALDSCKHSAMAE
jgi:hypothetical protein